MSLKGDFIHRQCQKQRNRLLEADLSEPAKGGVDRLEA
jgi:hypothetical protein